jgi:RimJ/RimL family protein N-acetyltransferase
MAPAADTDHGPSLTALGVNPAPEARWREMPELQGELIRLVPLDRAHAVGYLSASGGAGDAADAGADVFRWLTIRVPRTVQEATQQIEAALAARETGQRLAFAQIDARTGELVGTTSYYEIDPAQQSLAIGSTWIGRRWWRSGVNTESKLLLLSRAFEELGAVRVVWHTDSRNERSQTAIERLGAQREGLLRKHKLRPDGTWRDTVQFSMLDDDWPAARAALRASLDAHSLPRATS